MKSVTLKSVGYAKAQTMVSNALEHGESKGWIVAVAVADSHGFWSHSGAMTR